MASFHTKKSKLFLKLNIWTKIGSLEQCVASARKWPKFYSELKSKKMHNYRNFWTFVMGWKRNEGKMFFRQFMFWNCGQIEFGSRGVVENICTEIVSQQIGREWIFARCTLLKTRRTLWILQQKENVCKVIKKNKNNIWKVILIFIWKITSKVSFFPLKKILKFSHYFFQLLLIKNFSTNSPKK